MATRDVMIIIMMMMMMMMMMKLERRRRRVKVFDQFFPKLSLLSQRHFIIALRYILNF